MPALNSNNDVSVRVSTTADTKGIKDTQAALSTLSGESENSAKKTGILSDAFSSFGRTLQYVGQAFVAYQLIDSVKNFAGAAISASGELEQTNVSFQGLIGNVTEANKLFGELTQYANATPYGSKEVTAAAKQLLAFGANAEQVTTYVKQLGDVSAAGGGDLQALSLVTGQIFAQGKLRAQDMYQVINDGGAGLIKIMADNAGGMQNLTAEFDKGGIPASQYFDAVNKATGKSGFAFEGAQKQAGTLNGRISTLKDSATQFGEALLGVHTDPVLGLQIQQGGLFDRMKGGIEGITKALSDWQPAAQQLIPDLMKKMGELYDKVQNFLGPSFSALWSTIVHDLIPALSDFWHNIIEPLIPVIGGTFMEAVKLAVNILDDLFKIISPVIQYMADHKGVVEVLAGAFGALAGAMALGAAFDAIKIGFSVLQLVTFPSMIASIGAVSSTFVAAFPVAGILADIALVAKAIKTVNDAFNDMNAAKESKANEANQRSMAIANAKDKLAHGTAQQKISARNSLQNLGVPGYASGTNNAPSGWRVVGENGPELEYSKHGGEQIKDARSTARMLQGGMGGQSPAMVNHFTINNQVDMEKAVALLGWRLAIK